MAESRRSIVFSPSPDFQAPELGLLAALGATSLLSGQRLLQHFLYLWVGCMPGVWLSFAIRKRSMAFEDLFSTERGWSEAFARLLFAGLLTLVFGLLLSTETLVINIGKYPSHQFLWNIQVALLIGAICGLTEKSLSTKVVSRAAELLSFEPAPPTGAPTGAAQGVQAPTQAPLPQTAQPTQIQQPNQPGPQPQPEAPQATDADKGQ